MVDLIDYFVNNSFRVKESWLDRHNPQLLNVIKEKVVLDIPLKEKIYHYIHNIVNTPKCEVCGSKVKFISITKGYEKNCSISWNL